MKHKRHALLAFTGLSLFTACATMAPPQPPSLELPKPPSDLRAVRKGDTVILTWTVPSKTTDRQNVRTAGPTQICRGAEAQLTQCGQPVGMAEAQPVTNGVAAASTAKNTTKTSGAKSGGAKSGGAKSSTPKVTASYIDSLPGKLESDDPAGFVTYAVEALNAEGRGAGISNQVRVPTIRTAAPPRDFAAKVTSQGVALSWTGAIGAEGAGGIRSNVGSSVRYVYRVFRRAEDSADWTQVGESLGEAGAREISLTDSTFEWEKTYEYRAETVTVITRADKTEAQIEGADTPEVKVFADDVFPPAVPSGLQAVFSGPGQAAFVDLVWAPVSDVDLNGYNVYRREDGLAAVKLNAELVKTPAYRDANVVAGKNYSYSVSAVDLRGNESARSEEAEERVP